MATEYKGLYVTFEGDSTALSKAIAQINDEARHAQSTLRQVQNAAKLDPKSVNLMRDAVAAATKKVDASRQKVDALAQAHKSLSDAAEKGAGKLREMEAAGETGTDAYRMLKEEVDEAAKSLETIGTRLDISQARLKASQRQLLDLVNQADGVQRVGRSIQEAGDRVASFGEGIQGIGQGIQRVGGTLTTHVTMPLVAAAAASVKSAIDIDTSLTNVRKTTDMTAEGYDALKRGAIELSKTQPVPATTILDMEALGAQLGWSNDRLQDFAMTVSGLDIATDLDAETAATDLAQFANVTGMAQDQAQNYASAVVELGNHMATTESRIVDMAQNMASAGAQAGMSQADILGVAAATASLGMEAQAGGTAFSRTVTEISTQVSTNGKQLEEWAKLAHMSVDEFKSAWKTDATGTFEAVIRGMGDAQSSGEDLNVILAELGITETRQSDFLRRLAGSSDLVTDAVNMSNDAWRQNTALQDEVSNRNESDASKLDVLKNRVQGVVTVLGGPLIDAASDAIGAAEPLFQSIEQGAEAFSKMDKAQQQSVVSAAAAVAAAGPLVSLGGKIFEGAGKVVEGTGKVIKGVGKGIEAIGKVHAVASTTSTEVLEAAKATGGFGEKLGALLNPMTEAGGGVAAFVGQAVRIAPVVAIAGAAIAGMVAYVNELNQSAKDGQDALDGFNSAVDGADRLDEAAASIDAYAESMDSAQTSTDGLRQVTEASTDSLETMTSNWAAHADAIKKSNDQAEQSIATWTRTRDIIDQLAGSSQLSAEQTGQLQWALKQFNDATGETVGLEDALTGSYTDQNGAVQDLKGAVDQLAQARIDAAKQQAFEEGLTEAYKAQDDAQQHLAEAAAKRKQTYDEAYNAAIQGVTDQQLATAGLTREQYANAAALNALDTATIEVDGNTMRLNDAYDQAQQQVSDADSAVGRYSEKLGQMGSDEEAAADATQALQSALDGMGRSLQNSLLQMGTGSSELAQKLADAGVSAEQLGSLGTGSIEAMASAMAASGATVDELAERLKQMADIGIDDKHFTVSDDGTITDAQGRVWDLDQETIDGKHFTVNDDGTISVAEEGIDHLSATDVADKPFAVTDNGTTAQAQAQVDQLSATGVADKPFATTDGGTTASEQSQVDQLSATGVSNKPFVTTDGGTTSTEQSQVDQLSATGVASKSFATSSGGTTTRETGNVAALKSRLDSVPGTYNASVHASVSGSGAVDSLLSKLSTLASTGWTAVVHTVTGNAVGGVVVHATGGVATGPKVAATAGVYTSPTAIGTSGGSLQVIGEAGPEWYDGTHIVPLSSRYGRDFARMIADEVARSGLAGNTYVNKTVNQQTRVYESGDDLYAAASVMGYSAAAAMRSM